MEPHLTVLQERDRRIDRMAQLCFHCMARSLAPGWTHTRARPLRQQAGVATRSCSYTSWLWNAEARVELQQRLGSAAELLIEYTTSSDFNERRFGQLVMMKGWKRPPEEAVRALELIDDLEDKRADPCAVSSMPCLVCSAATASASASANDTFSHSMQHRSRSHACCSWGRTTREATHTT